MLKNFKEEFTFSERKSESTRVLEKYPKRCPLILTDMNNTFNLTKNKYLIPSSMTVTEFLITLRQKLKDNIKKEDAIYLFINKKLLTSTMTFGEIYEIEKDEDNFLYCTICKEATFGF